MTTTLDDRFAAVRRRIADGTLTRKQWGGVDAEGRELACLLLAAFPEVGHGAHYDACPALGLSESWARLTPWIDDAGTEAAWPATVTRWADLTHRACRVFTPADWTAFDYECRALAVREAMRHTTAAAVLAVCERVAVLCERAAAGDVAAPDEWAAALAWAAGAAAAAAAGAAAAEAAEADAADRLAAAMLDALERRVAGREP